MMSVVHILAYMGEMKKVYKYFKERHYFVDLGLILNYSAC